MEKKDFCKFIQRYLCDKGFEKIKERFYKNGNSFLCEVFVQKSAYGERYYINFNFYLGDFKRPYEIDRGGWQTHTPYVGGRFFFNQLTGYSCEYVDYDKEQLLKVLDQNMKMVILPPFDTGKQYLLNHFGTLYQTFLNNEEIIRLLIGKTD